jgi:hypothetical protein
MDHRHNASLRFGSIVGSAQFGKLQGEGLHRRTSDWRIRELAVVRRAPADAPPTVKECDFVGSEVDHALDKGLFA